MDSREEGVLKEGDIKPKMILDLRQLNGTISTYMYLRSLQYFIFCLCMSNVQKNGCIKIDITGTWTIEYKLKVQSCDE